MSQENVDLFLEGADAFNRGDIERALEGVAAEVVFEPQAAAIEGTFVGANGIREFLAGLADHYEVFQLQYSEVRDLGDRVLALGTGRTVARGSGIEQGWTLAVVATYSDGLETHWKDYGDVDRALEAVGLTE